MNVTRSGSAKVADKSRRGCKSTSRGPQSARDVKKNTVPLDDAGPRAADKTFPFGFDVRRSDGDPSRFFHQGLAAAQTRTSGGRVGARARPHKDRTRLNRLYGTVHS